MTYIAETERLYSLEELKEMISGTKMPLRCRIVPGRDAALSQEDALGTARTSSATRRQVANRRSGV
jgi:hypothetical protein